MCDTENYLIHSGLKRGFFSLSINIQCERCASRYYLLSFPCYPLPCFYQRSTSLHVISDLAASSRASTVAQSYNPYSLSLFLFLSRSIIRATDFRVRSGTRISYNRSSREVINILFGAGAFDRFSVCDRTKIENPSLHSLRSHSPYPSGSRSRTKRESTGE